MWLTSAKLRAALARIASAALAADAPRALGSVTLLPHQAEALARVEVHLAKNGGVLLAEEVGRGKTFVALAAAFRYSRPLIVLPASLRDSWSRAMDQAGVPCACVTHEALSAGRVPSVSPDLVIVDESHRFRNPRTRRHEALARLSARARVLMLSATPVQNSRRDLASQLSLFLGGAADVMTDAELASHVVRAGAELVPGMPHVAPPEWITLPCDDGALLDAILALPSPPRALDAGDAGLLRTLGLVRAWASSRAALQSALRRRARSLAAMEQCVSEGRVPARAELRSWLGMQGDAVQLGFVSLLVSAGGPSDMLSFAAAAIDAEQRALARIAALIRERPDPDLARLDALREVRRSHPAEKVLAFTEFASTARAVAAALESDGEVGLLTAHGARIASGTISRRELLARFAPVALGAAAPPRRERVTLLVATDLLSEGVNLQDASVVVHLDLPWNPARLTQRIGRVRRPGGREMVHSYLIAPPARAEQLLDVELRLRAKLESAAEVVGKSFSVIPALSRRGVQSTAPPSAGARSAELHGEMLHTLARWRRAERCGPRHASERSLRRTIVAAVTCTDRGWIGAARDGRIVAHLEDDPDRDRCAPRAVALLAKHVHRPRPCSAAELQRAMRDARDRLVRDATASACGSATPDSAVRSAVVRRITELVASAPRHLRPGVVSHAAAVRRACAQPLSLGLERELDTLMAATATGDVRFAERAAALLASAPASDHRSAPDDSLVALILLGDVQ